MFDPELVEKRKAEMALKKKQAMQKAQPGPLTGHHAVPGASISLDSIMDRDDSWVLTFKESELVKNAHGVRTVKGRWEIFDVQKYERSVDAVRREKLNAIWKRGKDE